jgi:hypothetical protein
MRKTIIRFTAWLLILCMFSCASTRKPRSMPFEAFNHRDLPQGFSIELTDGRIIPVRVGDVILTEVTPSEYIVYYNNGDRETFDRSGIRAIRLDVIDKDTQQKKTLLITGQVLLWIVYLALLALPLVLLLLLLNQY